MKPGGPGASPGLYCLHKSVVFSVRFGQAVHEKSPLSDEGEDRCLVTELLLQVADDLMAVLLLVLATRDVDPEVLIVAGLDDGLVKVRVGG